MDEMKSHWQEVYKTKSPEKQSWTQERPSPSIDWILESVSDRSSGVIDVGGGISTLIDHLLDSGYENPAVLDISAAALEQAKLRLGERSAQVEWIEADIASFSPTRVFSLWHDRAVFHFLTKAQDRRLYVAAMKKALAKGEKAIKLPSSSPYTPGLNPRSAASSAKTQV